MGYLVNNLLSIDQLANTLLWGEPDETISSRAWRCGVRAEKPKKRWRVARVIIDSLFWFDDDHCKRSYESELNRSHLPGSMRGIK